MSGTGMLRGVEAEPKVAGARGDVAPTIGDIAADRVGRIGAGMPNVSKTLAALAK